MDRSKLRETNGARRDDDADRRDASGAERDVESEARDGAAEARDSRAADRDQTANLRDRAADDRDAAIARTRTVESTTESPREAFMRRNSAADRKWSSEIRDAAETDRERASEDRDNASADRSASLIARGESASDRHVSAADRRESAEELANAAMDALTGAYLRGPGIAELQREMERAIRTASPLLLAFIDVDFLKTVNDSHGHAAGDRLLIAVVRALGENLRPYDRIVRYGGDEFVCALSAITEVDATARFSHVNRSLSAAPDSGSITFGVATMIAGDSVASLLERADRALYVNKRRT